MKRHFLRSIGAAAAIVMAGSAFAADVVVLDSTASSIAPGSIMNDAAAVDIPGGAVVTLIMADGETRTVAGPYTGPVGQAQSADAGVSALTASRGSETKVLGAIRAPKWEQKIGRAHV